MNKTDPNHSGTSAGTEGPLTPAELRAIGEEIAGEFPVAEGQDGVVLMDIDPHRLHAYWSLPPERLKRAWDDFAAGGQKVHLVMRFRRLSERETAGRPGAAAPPPTPLEAFDRELDDARGQLELRVRGDGGRYEAELGLTAEDGGWKSLARSNRVRMPPAGPSPEPGWATLNLAAETAAEAREPPAAAVAAEPLPMAEDPSLRGGPPDDLEPPFPNPLPPEQEPGAQGMEVHRVEPVVPRAPDSHFEASGVPDMAAASRLFSSAELGSSRFGGSIGGELELHAELHVWGRTRPGRELFLFGLPVPLTPDGGFDVWRELDPGSLLLPVLIDGGGKSTESE